MALLSLCRIIERGMHNAHFLANMYLPEIWLVAHPILQTKRATRALRIFGNAISIQGTSVISYSRSRPPRPALPASFINLHFARAKTTRIKLTPSRRRPVAAPSPPRRRLVVSSSSPRRRFIDI
jgi:hypothetical protein